MPVSCKNRIRFLRDKYKISQEQLAEILSVTQPTLSAYENEVRDIPTSSIIKLAEVFHVSIDYLLFRSDIAFLDDQDVCRRVKEMVDCLDISQVCAVQGYINRLIEETTKEVY